MTEIKQISESNQLVEVVDNSGLEPQTSAYIKSRFLPFFEQAAEWKEQAKSLVVTDSSQVDIMQKARQARLVLREIRVAADKTRKELKEDSNRYGKAVQGVYNIIEYLIVPIEKHLEQQEKFVELERERHAVQLREERRALVEPYAEFIPASMDLAELVQDDFDRLLSGAKFQFDTREEEKRKAELAAIEQRKLEAEERARIKAENEKLRAEAEAREAELANERAAKQAELAAEREANEARLRAEREERERIEAELQAKRDAEMRAAKEIERAEKARQRELKKQQAAPDIEKLEAFAENLRQLSIPVIKDDSLRAVLDRAIAEIESVRKRILGELVSAKA